MARPYDEIKTAVDAAHPTPVLTWVKHLDNPGHPHDDLSAARADVEFDGKLYAFEGHVLGISEELEWHGRMVVGETSMRLPSSPGSYPTWAQLKAAMATVYDNEIEVLRGRIAAEILAGEQLDDDGIGSARLPSSDASLASLTGTGVTFTLMPGIYDYSSPTTARQLLLTAAPTHPAATVAFAYFSGRPVETDTILFDTRSGANVIVVTVTAEDGTRQAYSFIITRS